MFEIKQDILTRLNDSLNELLGKDLLLYEMSYDTPVYTISKSKIIPVLKLLYEDEDLQFRFLTTLCGIHYPDSEQALGVVYHLHSFKHNLRIRIKSFTAIEDPVFPSATAIFNAANWMERETYDFYGLIFEGHPNLKRILNMDEMIDFPMRKEFPLEDQTREDKDDSMFGR